MELLLGSNLIALYFIVSIGIIAYERFSDVQKLMILYGISYIVLALDILAWQPLLPAAFAVYFIFLEYLTADRWKLRIVRSFSNKLLDFLFLIFIQYYGFLFLLAVLMWGYADDIEASLHMAGAEAAAMVILIRILSIFSILICIHKTSAQKFSVKSFSDIMTIIDKYHLHSFNYDSIDKDIFNILADIEDKSYFIRKNSYNFLSVEFILYRLRRFRTYIEKCTCREKLRRTGSAIEHYIYATKHIRGYSTIEMQLIRNIALQQGYNYKIRRKIFEFVYSKVLFSGLRAYFEDNIYSKREKYKEYLLCLYCSVVKTRINGKDYKPFYKAFEHQDMTTWDKDTMFVASMGLSNRGPEFYFSKPYIDIAMKYGLKPLKLSERYYSTTISDESMTK